MTTFFCRRLAIHGENEKALIAQKGNLDIPRRNSFIHSLVEISRHVAKNFRNAIQEKIS